MKKLVCLDKNQNLFFSKSKFPESEVLIQKWVEKIKRVSHVEKTEKCRIPRFERVSTPWNQSGYKSGETPHFSILRIWS
jgi:hypothetical protein